MEFSLQDIYPPMVSLMLPKSFVDMPELIAKQKYPSEYQPTVIKTSYDLAVNFAFQYFDQKMKEVFGMRLDSVFYNNIITIFDSSMDRIFGTDIKKTEAVCRFENRGYFRLEYEYFPNHYKIVVENELRTFDITILDDEQAFRSLYGITEFNNGLSKEGIENAISLLKTVLEKNDFAMYFHKDGKMYRRSSEGIKRIKHIEDILNG